MFGKPEWFTKKKWGWGLTPATRQGWWFVGGSAALVAVPFSVLMVSRGMPEALLWVGLSAAALVLEVRSILRAMQPPGEKKDVLYIGDEEHDSVRTGKLDLKLRR